MAESNDPPNRAPGPAGPRGPGTQPCRPVPRVHAFGKGGQALRRDPRTPPAMQGWLHKQDSSGLRLWKRRWFVLVDLCLYYYRDSSEQRVRGGLPLPGYEIRVLPPAPRAPRAPQFLFTAEHPGMRTYCLGAETPEELHAWVCALRRGASPLPGSPRPLSVQTPQEPRSAGPPSPPLPTRPPGRSSLCPPGEGLGDTPAPPPRSPPVPPLPSGKVPPAQEEPPARGCPGDTLWGQRGHPDPGPAPAGRSPPKSRLPGAPPCPPERHTAANQRPPRGHAPAPPANEASPRRRTGAGGRGRGRDGGAGRPIRITLLQASF